jgi:adenine-specific DNA methylase
VERRVGADGKARKVAVAGEVDAAELVQGGKALATGTRRCLLLQGDSRTLPLADRSVDFVVTDPPYYDSVQYSDLAGFFRAWLPHLLPGAADWHYDVSGAAVAGDTFAAVLGGVMCEAVRVLRRPRGRVVFTYHHWRPAAWVDLTLALRGAGLVLVNCYVVPSENPVSVHIQNMRALTHDCILVLAPRDVGATARTWCPPDTVSAAGSAAFCRDCGEVLGALLAEEALSPDAVRGEWRRRVPAH